MNHLIIEALNVRAIDAKIAEHVFGLKTENCRPDIWDHASHYEHSPGRLDPIPSYSTDIALAIGVLEKLHEDETIGSWHIYSGYAELEISIEYAGQGHTEQFRGKPLPEAICRHVLHVLGVQL